MAPTKMEKYELINPADYRVVVDDQQQLVLNENGDVTVMNNESRNCMAVSNSEDVLKMFNFGCHGNYKSTSGSPKDAPQTIFMIDSVMPSKSSSKSNCTDKKKTFNPNRLARTTKSSSERNSKAILEMLELVASKKYQDMFNSPCTVKTRAWKKIYKDLLLKGYKVAKSVTEGGVKCYKKWKYLKKMYKKYIMNEINPKSLTLKCKPPYFDMLDKILKQSNKYSKTTVISDDMAEPDALDNDSIHLMNDSNTELDNIDYLYGPSEDPCYVVNNSGHDSKRIEVEPVIIKRSTLYGGDNGDGGGHTDVGLPCSLSASHRHRRVQQQNAMERILQQLVHVHKDTLAIYDQHFTRMEDLMKENDGQVKRLTDITNQFLHSRLMTDRNNDKNNDMSTSMTLLND